MGLDEQTKSRVKQQVEFYFSDSNLPRDKFLLGEINKTSEGYVDVALLCTFSRMAALLGLPPGSKASDVPQQHRDFVASSLDGSDSVSLSSDKMGVKRSKPLDSPEALTKAIDERSLYASPFPYNVTLDALTEFFKAQAPVNAVRMRRHITSKDFKGSVFVEFASEDIAREVMSRQLVFEGAPLQMQPKLKYLASKVDDRHAKPNSPYLQQAAAADSKQGPEQAGTQSEAAAAPQQPATQEASPAAEPAAPERAATANGAEAPELLAAADAQAAAEEAAPETEAADGAEAVEFESGLVIAFAFPEGETVNPDLFHGMVKEAFGGREAGVHYVEYKKGESSGYVRFGKAEEVQAALKERRGDDGKALIGGSKADLRRVEGDEEREYHAKAAASRKERETANAGRAGGRGRGGGGGRGRGGKRPFQGRQGGRAGGRGKRARQ